MNKYSYLSKEFEKGQFLVLFLLLIVVILVISALAVDGGLVYVEQRRTQNAADNTSLGTALAWCRSQPDYLSEGYTVADENGYDDNGTTNDVTINIPPVYGISAGRSGMVEAIVQSVIPSTFASVVNINSFTVSGRAVSACDRGGNYALFAGGEDCDKQIDWSGGSVQVNGYIHSNNNVDISGSNNDVNGLITYVTDYDAHESTTLNPAAGNPLPSGVLSYPVDFQWEDYAPGGAKAIEAVSHSQYYSFSGKIDNGLLEANSLIQEIGGNWVLSDGLYYTTDDIDIGYGDVIGNNVTFVAGGTINIAGSNQYLQPYVDGLLAFSYKDPDNRCSDTIVNFNGSDIIEWRGIVYAPYGVIDMSGSGNSAYYGTLIGYAIKVAGQDLIITYDEDLFPAEISLIE